MDLRIKIIEILNNIGDTIELSRLFDDKMTDNELLKHPSLYSKVLSTLGRKDEFERKIDLALEKAITSSDIDEIYEMGKIFYKLGKSEEFDKKTLGRVREREQMLRALQRRYNRNPRSISYSL